MFRKAVLLVVFVSALLGNVSFAQQESTLQVSGAWTRPSFVENAVGAAYFTVFNRGDEADTLVSVTTPVAQIAELHTMTMQNDIMRMRPVGSLDIPAGSMVTLAPSGLHVMMMGMTAQFSEGDTIPLTLTFASGTVLETEARVTDEPFPEMLPADSLTAAQLDAVAAGIYVGQVVDPPVRVQDFLLPGSEDGPMSLSDSNGTWRVIFIGYMHCPDLCPLTLVDYKQAIGLLGEEAAQVSFVFISVDAQRDTPEKLRPYLDHFDPSIVGFSADDVTLGQIQPDYGFFYERRLESDRLAVYSIDHSTRSYLVDPQGILRASLSYATKPDIIANTLRWYLDQ